MADLRRAVEGQAGACASEEAVAALKEFLVLELVCTGKGQVSGGSRLPDMSLSLAGQCQRCTEHITHGSIGWTPPRHARTPIHITLVIVKSIIAATSGFY